MTSVDELSVATLEDSLEMSFAQCQPWGVIDVQTFKDCMMWDLAYMVDEELITEEDDVALAQCVLTTDPETFRDCAFGHIRL